MSNSKTDWLINQSQSIDLLRFPLAIAVIFIHLSPDVVNLQTAPFALLSEEGLYNTTVIILSKVLAGCAVPAFFLISGFLFFLNFNGCLGKWYQKKFNSRVKTLIIPYFAWNALVFISAILLKIRKVLLGYETWEMIGEYVNENWLKCFYNYSYWQTSGNIFGQPTFSSAPIDIPLWFLRDLIIMVICAPLIYYFIKKCQIWGIILLGLLYITNISPTVPGFGITAFFFFSLGAYFSLNKRNLIVFSRQAWLIFLTLSLILFVPCIYFCGVRSWVNLIVDRVYTISTVFSLFIFSSWVVQKYRIRPLPMLINSCFFVYAAHTIFILGIALRVMQIIIPGNGLIKEWICYLTTPFLTAGICVTLYYILTKYFECIALPLTGRR